MEPYEELEQEFLKYVGWGYPVACSSGTAALHLALEALELPQGSQVIVPEFTMIACARAVVLAGLKPVFVDCDENGLMDFDRIHRYITPLTKAIMPVHVYGRDISRSDLNAFYMLINKRHPGIHIVEDWAEHTKPNSEPYSDALCWSFYKNKIVHGEEGGMILFRNHRKAQLAKLLRCQGFTKEHDFRHIPRGHNYRMSNSSASITLTSLVQVETNLEHRKYIESVYNSVIPAELHRPLRSAPWLYDVFISGKTTVDTVVTKLNLRGIQARHSFKPMSSQPEFIGHWTQLNAHSLSNSTICLPITDTMTMKDATDIALAFLECQ